MVDQIVDNFAFWDGTILVNLEHVLFEFEQHLKDAVENRETDFNVVDSTSCCKYFKHLLCDFDQYLTVGNVTFYLSWVEYVLLKFGYKKIEFIHIFLTDFIMNNLCDFFIAFQHTDQQKQFL